jgi:hypothetical protein
LTQGTGRGICWWSNVENKNVIYFYILIFRIYKKC